MWSQIFSSLAVGFLLLMVGFLFWMQQGLKTVLVRLEGEQVITAYLSPSVDSTNEKKIVDTIQMSLGSHSETEIELSNIKMVSHSEFLNQLKEQYPELVRELEDLGQEAQQMIPKYISISGVFPQSTVEKIRRMPGIESAESSGDRYHHIVSAFSALRWVARVLAVGICLALLSGLILLARMNGYLHRDALHLLKFWGADSKTLMTPGTVSGLLVGILGGIVAAVNWLTLGVWLERQVRGLSPMLKGLPSFDQPLAFALLLIGTLIGGAAGIFASISSAKAGSEGSLA